MFQAIQISDFDSIHITLLGWTSQRLPNARVMFSPRQVRRPHPSSPRALWGLLCTGKAILSLRKWLGHKVCVNDRKEDEINL